MATNSTNTLAGLLMLNDERMADVYPTDVLNDAPVLQQMFAVPASSGGILHKYLRTLTAPGAGFRLVNEGITNAAGTFEDVSVSLALLDATFSRDKAVAVGYGKGEIAYMDKESLKSLQAAFFGVECSIFRASINKQFTGLPGSTFWDETGDEQVVDAGGTGTRSVWLLRSAEDGIAIIAGNEGRVDMARADAQIQAIDSLSRPYPALQRVIMGWFGLQIGSKYDGVRICNLDGTDDDLLTDDLISSALALFPAGRGANMIVMDRTSRKELQQSRTATNPTGAPAPFPMDAFGVPIIVTEALTTEDQLTTSSTTTTTTSQD